MPKNDAINTLSQQDWKRDREAAGIKKSASGSSVGDKLTKYHNARNALKVLFQQKSTDIRAMMNSANDANKLEKLGTYQDGYKMLKAVCETLKTLVEALQAMKKRTEAAKTAAEKKKSLTAALSTFDTLVGTMITDGQRKLGKWEQARQTWKAAKIKELAPVILRGGMF
jgi:hypothetical protein